MKTPTTDLKHLYKYSQDRGDPLSEDHKGPGCSWNQEDEVDTNSILGGSCLMATKRWTVGPYIFIVLQ